MGKRARERMKRETLPGEASVAAPVATARRRLRCLACRHENTDGERFCEACGSSLNLKFCSACEAVNGDTAVICHGCGAALGTAASSEIEAESRFAVPNARRSRMGWALSLAALLASAVLAYQHFSQEAATAVVESKDESADARVAAPSSSESGPVRDAVSAATAPAAAGQPAGAGSMPKASRTPIPVTHTRPAPAARARPPTRECSEAVAALALCEIRDDRGGK